MDVWGAGCVLFELLALYPLFPGADEIDQLHRIHRVLGSPTDQVLTKLLKTGSRYSHIAFQNQIATGFTHLLLGTSQDCLDLLTMMLVYDSSERITSLDALKHPYLREFQQQILDLNGSDQVKNNKVSADDEISRSLPDFRNRTMTDILSGSVIENSFQLPMKSEIVHPTVYMSPIKSTIHQSMVHSSTKVSTLQPQRSSKILNNATMAKRQSLLNGNHNQMKLPSIENKKRFHSHSNEPKRIDPFHQQRIEKNLWPKNKLYANVASSGYGSSYNPTTISIKEKTKSKLIDTKASTGKMYLSTLR